MSWLIFGRGVLTQPTLHGMPSTIRHSMVNLRFLCARTTSLYLYSSLSLVRLTGVLFLLTFNLIPTCVHHDKSYLLQSYKTDIFKNAYIFSSKLGFTIAFGLNLTHLIHLLLCKIQFCVSFDIQCAPNGMIIILAGRIKGHMKTRFVPKMNALCVTSFSNRILDIGYISSGCCLGLLGVKVGTIL